MTLPTSMVTFWTPGAVPYDSLYPATSGSLLRSHDAVAALAPDATLDTTIRANTMRKQHSCAFETADIKGSRHALQDGCQPKMAAIDRQQAVTVIRSVSILPGAEHIFLAVQS